MEESIALSEDGQRMGELNFELSGLGDWGSKACDSDHGARVGA
jgi:hypothetical protein